MKEMTSIVAKKNETPVSDVAESLQKGPLFIPATDIYESKDVITVVCDVPGVEESQVHVALENHVLSITATQTAETSEGFECLHRGYQTGLYRRTFTIPEDIDREKIGAELKQGVLRVTLPKAEAAKPRTIKVSAA